MTEGGLAFPEPSVVDSFEVIESREQIGESQLPPLLILSTLRDFLDRNELGAGDIAVTRVGGNSNCTFLLERDSLRLVLRRPPRPPWPPSAHDVVREARLQIALATQGLPVPNVRVICEDLQVIGSPFYIMDYVDGMIIQDTLPGWLDEPNRFALGEALVDGLAAIHAADQSHELLVPFARPGNYLERQLIRFEKLWKINATRDLPEVRAVYERLTAALPAPVQNTVVHGDYRLGNVLVESTRPAVAAVLDWEMGAIGDPRADVGYFLATYSDGDAHRTVVELSPATEAPGFPTRRDLVERYERITGRDLGSLAWFEALALWKSAIFSEAIFARHMRGEIAGDTFSTALDAGVPELARAAHRILSA